MNKACIPQDSLPELLRQVLHQMPRAREQELQRDHLVPQQVPRKGHRALAREWSQRVRQEPGQEFQKDCLLPELEPLLQRGHQGLERE